ncbi:MAG: pyruvate kinase [Ignavibacteria bacterium]|nr:pyruvate kinase [Ignavibacteria bacterium]
MEGRTKIVCTVGPSTNTVEILVGLIKAGMDVIRLNFSHGTHQDHRKTLDSICEATKRTGRELAVVQDLQGPKIRVGGLSAPSVELRSGSQFVLTTERIIGDAKRVSTNYANLTKDVQPGDIILLDDGRLLLRVVEINQHDVLCEVEVGGKLSANKGINLPGTSISAPSLTEKDIQDLEFGIQNDVDYVALSFVRTADDIRKLRKAITNRVEEGHLLPIIAKIEKPQAVDNIDEIIAKADGIMVARGDLGVEMPPEDVPMLQKMIIKKCNRVGKPVIIATQMLESMIHSPAPTRAEASDVANAVVDGGDALMLSGETSVGEYPIQAVQIMDRIIRKMESEKVSPARVVEQDLSIIDDRLDALGRSACVLAEQMNASAIVTVTHSGETAKVVSRYRPRAKIIAITDRTRILRHLNLVWGVNGLVVEDLKDDSDKALEKIQKRLVTTGLIKRGEYVVTLAGLPFFARGSANFIKVEQIV